ncbi:MAG TPA: rod shape-determining protein RodA [Candidatus Limnocylindrales bacterium]|nr:rod shape-determining protein RodA [Candidatus Limnocylindrales bacterium]
MGVLHAESARASAWVGRSAGAVWRLYDIQLTVYAALLLGIGLVMAYTNSISGGDSALETGSTFTRGLLWAALAIVAFAAATAFDYRWLRTFAWPLYGLNLALLALTLVVGDGVGGAQRWIYLGPLSFQFSELAKVIMIAVLANYLAARHDRLDSLMVILGACLLVVPPWILVLMQPDLGTSLVFGAILAGMLFMSGASMRWLGLLAASTIAAMPFIWSNILRDYQKERITAFLDPGADIQGAGYQLYQSQVAVGSGGILGKGLTNGTQNQLDFLPVQETDFVFAILAEELGLVGGIVVFALFVLLLWRILLVAWRSRDPFGVAFASGMASMLLFQLVVNVGMVIGIMPITGIPLPFVTHGGASLISLALGLGVLQSINIRQARAEW